MLTKKKASLAAGLEINERDQIFTPNSLRLRPMPS
jgi:hypothetical protein